MALTKIVSASAGSVTWVTSCITCNTSCTLQNCFCGSFLPNPATTNLCINGVKVSPASTSANSSFGVNSQNFYNKGTVICSGTEATLMTGYLFD